MRKYLMVCVILAVLFWGTVPVIADEPESLYALSAVLMDADSGRVLYEKNGDEMRAMASTTKIMTLLIGFAAAVFLALPIEAICSYVDRHH